MDSSPYDLSSTYMPVTGSGPQELLDGWARKLVEAHYMIAFAVIVVLLILVIYLMRKKEGFGGGPTSTLRSTTGDQFGLAGKERLENQRDTSAFAQQVQTASGASFVIDPAATPGMAGSLGYQVLHSSDFDCGNRKSAGNDAWSWQMGVLNEPLVGHPRTENDFSKILPGN